MAESSVPSAPDPAGGRPGGIRSRLDWAKAERNAAEEALREKRKRSAIVDAGFEIQELDVHVGGGILAGAVAFRVFLFLVPFVYIVFTVFDAAARAAAQDPGQVAKSVGITGLLASAVVGTSDIGGWSQFFLLTGAAVALVLTTNSMIKTLYVVHWLVWRIPRTKPRGLLPIATAVGIATGFTALAVLANDLRRTAGAAGALFGFLIVTAGAFAVWWWVSWRLPHASTNYSGLIPGAVTMAIGVEALHLLTTYWIGHLVARKSNTYGAVGIALAVLLWVYVLGRVVVASAGINATLWRRRQRSTVGLLEDDGGHVTIR